MRTPLRRYVALLVLTLAHGPVSADTTRRSETQPSVQAAPVTAREPTAAALETPGKATPSASFSPTWRYRHFDAWDAGIAVGGGVVALTAQLLGPPKSARWEGGVLFDDAVRRALLARSRAGRDRARSVGDAFYISGALAPTLIDVLVVGLAVHQAPAVSAQMMLINIEAYAVAGAVLVGSERVFARARPSAEPCVADPEYENFCGAEDHAASFISGHTGIVATSAGLLCAHHQYLHLYGHPVADALACGVGIGAAAVTGAARLVNDRHYATDILAAFAVGALGGYLLPVLRFYSFPDAEAGAGRFREWALLPNVGTTHLGLTVYRAL